MIALIFILGIIVVGALFVVGIYNRLVSNNIKVDAAWGDIDVQLKRRYDLIGNLVETVKGYATHEKSVFEEVTKARSVAMGAGGPAARAEAENSLTDTLKTLFAVAENYPELKANQNFLSLQDDLEETENKIESSRRYYNGTVRDFNTIREVFPNTLVTALFSGKFPKREMFEVEREEEREAPKVEF
jgi:LemA protein